MVILHCLIKANTEKEKSKKMIIIIPVCIEK